MSGDLNVSQLTVATTIAASDLLYYGKSPYGVGDDRAITYNNFKTQLNVTDTYSFNTTNKTVQGAINELFSLVSAEDLWDRADLGAGNWVITPHIATDKLQLPYLSSAGIGAVLYLNPGVTDNTVVASQFFTYDGTSLLLKSDTWATNFVALATTGVINLQYSSAVQKGFFINIANIENEASMIGYESGLYFTQCYYDLNVPALIKEGYLAFGTETNWTATASTQNSYFTLYNVHNGNWNQVLYISSLGVGTIYGIWAYSSTPTLSNDNELVYKKYVDDLVGSNSFVHEDLSAQIIAPGKTSFTLGHTLNTSKVSFVIVNHAYYVYLKDFTVSGTTLTWTNGYVLQIGNSFDIYYSY
jgi:hypothetical protein